MVMGGASTETKFSRVTMYASRLRRPPAPDRRVRTAGVASPAISGGVLCSHSSSRRVSATACCRLAYEFERIATHVRLVGAGADGLGEDVSVLRETSLEGRDLGMPRSSL